MKTTLISVFVLTLLIAPFSFAQAEEDAHQETGHDHAAGGDDHQEGASEEVEHKEEHGEEGEHEEEGGTATKMRPVAMKKQPPRASMPNRKTWPALKWQRSKASALTMKYTRPVSC